MVIRALLIVATCSCLCFSQTVQKPTDVLDDGSAFLWIEAETATFSREDAAGVDLGIDDPTTGFIRVSKSNPIQTITEVDGVEVVKGGLDVLTADANASGDAAIFHNLGGGGANRATVQAQFAIPATYYLYMHYSMYNRDSNNNYGNEDSIYVAPGWNTDSRADWIDYDGVDPFGDPKTGNSNRDGWMPLGKDIMSAGDIETHNTADEDFWDGQFHWAVFDIAVEMDENDNWGGDFGHGIQLEVSDEQAAEGTVLDYEIATREPYGVIDGFLFSTSPSLLEDFTQEQMDTFFLNLGGPVGVTGDFDSSGVLDLADVNSLIAEMVAGTNNAAFNLNENVSVDQEDLSVWVKDLRKTWFGDANLDGEFNSGDLVNVFGAGKFETGQAATWEQGDWNGDGVFGSGDLVRAFQDGGFEQGPIAANSVPEPSSLVLLLIATLALAPRRTRR